VHAIVSIPARALADHAPEPALQALIRLFALDSSE
jgi:hypothetical protein